MPAVNSLSLSMLKLALIFCLSAVCYGEELTAQEVFDRARANVARQLSAVANYTCVLTVDRTLYVEPPRFASGCKGADRITEKPFMHDRLRLDVAVSEGKEIFSWHGGSKFSSSGVNDVVKSGPISSGSFVGYLRNILFTQGVAISLNKAESSKEAYAFRYYVPLNSSGYHVRGGGKGSFLVPYHGTFVVRGDTFQLQSLSVNTGDIPKAAEVCAADSEISYQNVEIAGKSLLIPKSFQLHMLDANAVDTFSQSEYSQCREFRGESTLRFDFDDSPQGQSTATVHDEWLPAGAELHVRLSSTIDDQKSFTGDPVGGVLLNPVRVKNLNITVPKGAVLSGVVSRMEMRYQPNRYYVVAIRWDRMTWGQNSLLLNAKPRHLYPQGRRFGPGYSGRSSRPTIDEFEEEGTFVWPSNHFRMDQTFTAFFETTERLKETASENEQ